MTLFGCELECECCGDVRRRCQLNNKESRITMGSFGGDGEDDMDAGIVSVTIGKSFPLFGQKYTLKC
jgi:hypothetical protein